MRLRAGRLRHRLVLQRQVETRTASGDVVITWTTDSTVWGAIEPLSGKEYLAASQTQNETNVRVVTRYHATLAETWRIVNDGKVYSILFIVNEDERDRMMLIMCSKGVKEAGNLPQETFN